MTWALAGFAGLVVLGLVGRVLYRRARLRALDDSARFPLLRAQVFDLLTQMTHDPPETGFCVGNRDFATPLLRAGKRHGAWVVQVEQKMFVMPAAEAAWLALQASKAAVEERKTLRLLCGAPAADAWDEPTPPADTLALLNQYAPGTLDGRVYSDYVLCIYDKSKPAKLAAFRQSDGCLSCGGSAFNARERAQLWAILERHGIKLWRRPE